MEEELIREVCDRIREHFAKNNHDSYSDAMSVAFAIAAGTLYEKEKCDYVKVYDAVLKVVQEIVFG